jgi:hypothetical protein
MKLESAKILALQASLRMRREALAGRRRKAIEALRQSEYWARFYYQRGGSGPLDPPHLS